MPLEADAAKWWDDPDLHAVRQRIERRRAREASGEFQAVTGTAARAPRKRGVREVHGIARLVPTESGPAAGPERERRHEAGPGPGRRRFAAGPGREARPDAGPGRERRYTRPRPRPVERLGPRPDIIAAWAVVLGVVLLLVAILTAHS